MNDLKRRLAGGECVTGAWLELGSPDVAEVLVRHGWDVIVVDGEHGIGDIETWVACARAIEAAGGTVILRVPSGDPALLKRVLDRGFTSLIVPLVNTAEEADAIARACRYPPRGFRGYAAPATRSSGYGSRPDYARSESHEELLLFVQCETGDAVGNVAEVAAVDGIDGVFVGPNDLSATLGHLERMDDPETQSALATVDETLERSGTLMATVCGAGRSWPELRDLGYRLIVGVSDVGMLTGSARAAREECDAVLS